MVVTQALLLMRRQHQVSQYYKEYLCQNTDRIDKFIKVYMKYPLIFPCISQVGPRASDDVNLPQFCPFFQRDQQNETSHFKPLAGEGGG